MTSTDYMLPQLPLGGADITIVRWLKQPGDAVDPGEPLLVVANDRIEAALPALHAGVLEQILAAEGAAAAAGTLVAIIAANSSVPVTDTPGTAQSVVRISPVAQNIAKRHRVDITIISGTGIAGRIVKSDLFAALGDQAPRREALPRAEPSIRHPPSPTMLTAINVDLERVAALIAEHGPSFARRRRELSYRVCVALAAVAALPYHPLLNGYWADTTIVAPRRVHLAIVPRAGASPRLVRDAQDMNLRGLARALSSAAEPGGQGGTFTIADLGDQIWGDPGKWAGVGAALGLGAVRACPLVIGSEGLERVAVRHAALLTLAYDLRVLDQSYADAFLRDVKSRLEQFQI